MKEAATLSKKEIAVTEMIAWGDSKKDVSNKMVISTRTVESIVRKILKKTGCTKSTELSAWWFCTRYGIPFTESPVFKTFTMTFIIVLLLLGGTIFKSLLNIYFIISATML